VNGTALVWVLAVCGGDCGPYLPGWYAVPVVAAVVAMIVMIARHRRRALRGRIGEVERAALRAAASDPAFAPEAVRGEAEKLFRAVRRAWDERDAGRLAELVAPEVFPELARGMDDRAHRVVVKTVKEVALVGLDQEAGRVVVYVEATLRDYRERDGGSAPGISAFKRVWQYWTLVRAGHHWRVERVEDAATAAGVLDALIVVRDAERADEPVAPVRPAYANVAQRIEQELRALGAWDQPAPDGPASGAFGGADRSFTQWLRYDLVPQLHAVADGRRSPPAQSMVGTRAVREFDGLDAAEPLVAVLLELDRLAESGGERRPCSQSRGSGASR
jgi:hypothetical protein